MNTAAGGATVDHRDGGARRVIESAFELLELVHTLEPVRLVELTEKAGMPRATVHRMLAQLIAVGAVCRDGAHYCLGASLLRLGAAVGPQRRLRHAARRPIAELAAATGAAVSLSGRIGDDLLFVDAVQAAMNCQSPPRSVRRCRPTPPKHVRTSSSHALHRLSMPAAPSPISVVSQSPCRSVATGLRRLQLWSTHHGRHRGYWPRPAPPPRESPPRCVNPEFSHARPRPGLSLSGPLVCTSESPFLGSRE